MSFFVPINLTFNISLFLQIRHTVPGYRSHTDVYKRQDLLLCQIYGDLVSVLPADKQTENQTDNLGGFLVDYPKILVVRVFDITVGGLDVYKRQHLRIF